MKLHNHSTFALLLAASAGLLRCAPADDARPGPAARSAALLPAGVPSDPLDPKELSTASRLIGKTASWPSVCPPADPTPTGTWLVSPLFSVAPGHPGLGSFCLYTWQPSSPGLAPDTGGLPFDGTTPPLQWLHHDEHTVGPLGPSDPFMDVPIEPYDELLEQQRRFAGVPSARHKFPPPGFRPTSVAVVDTSPDLRWKQPYLSRGRSLHGLVMTRLIEGVACPTDLWGSPLGACAAHVDALLGLPQVNRDEVDTTFGGYFGTQGQLADAIVRAVAAWQNDGKSAAHRLVINLSVGWIPRQGQDGEQPIENLSVSAQSVHAALKHAACHGALIVAAAGNADGSVDLQSGPMLPAGWEAHPAPSSAECQKFEPKGYTVLPATFPVLAPAGVYNPLVFAVGAVDGDDLPINSTRPQGRSRLVAPGAHGVGLVPAGRTLASPGSELPLSGPVVAPTLTGTSVAAAFVSGVASTLWAYAPSLTAAELMDAIYEAGVDLSSRPGGDAEFPGAAAGRADPIRRLDFCGAAAHLCDKGQADACELLFACPASTKAYAGRPFRFSPSGAQRLRKRFEGTEPLPQKFSGEPKYIHECSALAFFSSPGAEPIRLCPNLIEYGTTAAPWVDPQPGAPGCGRCNSFLVDSYGDEYESLLGLYIYLDTAGDFGNVSTAVTLRSGERVVYDLSRTLPRLAGLTPYRVTGLPLSSAQAAEIQSVALTFTPLSSFDVRLRSYTVEIQTPEPIY